jgi:hypothetical protein
MPDAVNKKASWRFWKCLKCLKEPPFIGQRYRVEGGPMKLLTKLINVPYHCSLYTFRCQTLDDLVRNETTYGKWQVARGCFTQSG